MRYSDPKAWASVMGRDLPMADRQPLEIVRLAKDGTLGIHKDTLQQMGIRPEDPVALESECGRWLLRPSADGRRVGERVRIKLKPAEELAAALTAAGGYGVVCGSGERAEILPLRVETHAPDALGPRFIDEFADGCVVRHAIGEPGADGWTEETLADLEDLVCAEPFRVDPVIVIAEGQDWAAHMTRTRILAKPSAREGEIGLKLVADVHAGRQADGSWGSASATAYAVLRLLTLGEKPRDRRIQRACEWLLELPEPSPRPGMWMLSEEYMTEWLSRRNSKGLRKFAACETQRASPREDNSFYSWDFPDAEQDQFSGQEMQQVIPTCARHHPPACEPRITHVSALAAEALIRAGHGDHPRLRRYLNTLYHVGGEWGYWCGCGALGYYDYDVEAPEDQPDFSRRRAGDEGRKDLSPWRWVDRAAGSVRLSGASLRCSIRPPTRGTYVEPFSWRWLDNSDGPLALVGIAWQNGDCWAKVNRALAAHSACKGSLTERLALYQASRYQSSTGEWPEAFPAGILAWLGLYDARAAKALVLKTVPWFREHQSDDGLWYQECLPQAEWGTQATPARPRLATYHILAALSRFGVLRRLRG